MDLKKTKYKEIFKLEKMLKDAGIPYKFYELDGGLKDMIPEWEHYHINYPNKDHWVISVIEGIGTYGAEQDRLEIMGGLTPYERFINDDATVLGYLTAKNVFKRIKNDYERRLKEYEEDSKRSR